MFKASVFWFLLHIIFLWVLLNRGKKRQTLTLESQEKRNCWPSSQLVNRTWPGLGRQVPPPPRLWLFKDIIVIFHAVTVCSCQCMSNSLPCGSDLLAVMNSSQGKQVKLQYLLNFKTWQSINEDHHCLISIEYCLIVPLFPCPLAAVICRYFSRIPFSSVTTPECFWELLFFGCTWVSNH